MTARSRRRGAWMVGSLVTLAGTAAVAVARARRVEPGVLAPLPAPARVAAVIPVLDEAATITSVLAELRAVGIVEVVVVDGGSSDGTPDLAAAAGAVVVAERRRGYGRACAAGAAATTADVVVFLDGDGSDDPAFVPSLLADVCDDGAALALGVRTRCEHGAMLPHQVLGNRVVAGLLWLVHGVAVSDIPPMRAVRRDVLERLDMREMTYGWPTEMIVRTARAGLPITQIDVRARCRAGGESKIAGRLAPSLMAGVRMVGVVLRLA